MLEFRRERSGKFDARHVQNLANGLNRKLNNATGDHGDGLRPATGDLYLDFTRDAEPTKDLGEPRGGTAWHRDLLRA